MEFSTKFNEFNRLVVDALSSYFPENVHPFQDEDEILYFRGPSPSAKGNTELVTHVSVPLEKEAKEELELVDENKRLEMMGNLVRHLATQIKYKYNKNFIGRLALRVPGTLAILKAYEE